MGKNDACFIEVAWTVGGRGPAKCQIIHKDVVFSVSRLHIANTFFASWLININARQAYYAANFMDNVRYLRFLPHHVFLDEREVYLQPLAREHIRTDPLPFRCCSHAAQTCERAWRWSAAAAAIPFIMYVFSFFTGSCCHIPYEICTCILGWFVWLNCEKEPEK